jgi:dolichol kinase
MLGWVCGNVSPKTLFLEDHNLTQENYTDLSYWEIASGSIFFQFSLYIAARLAHRGFTLGELGLVVFGATALFTELLNLTVARVRPTNSG